MSSGFAPEPIGFAVDGDEWGISNEEEIYKGGNTVEKDGHYHVHVETVVDEDVGKEDKLRNINVTMEILQGTQIDQIGKKIYHRLYLAKWVDGKDKTKGQESVSKGQMKNIIRFAMAFGLLDKSEIGSSVSIPFHALAGRQGMVEVKKEADRVVKDDNGNEKTYKGQFRIPFSNAWPLGHEAVVGIPVDATAASQQNLRDHGTGFEDGAGSSDLDSL